MKTAVQLIFLVIWFLWPAGYGVTQETLISGKTMGTTYHVKVVTGYSVKSEELKEKIDTRLKEINQSMSTFIKDSEISRFNRLSCVGERFCASDDFLSVMIVAENLYKLSNGAWDGTIMPLVNLWGFGNKEKKRDIPKKKEIDRLLPEICFEHIDIVENRYLVKRKVPISVDLASIAKGYAVDQIAELIKTSGIQNFIVEIGGEVYASGFREDGKLWRVGINRPDKDAPFDQAHKIVASHNRALATSGDYRNFFEIYDKSYSHIFNPKTGYPVSNRVVSASVLADKCAFADGLATALMVMGVEKGLQLVNTIDGVECLIVVREKDGSLSDHCSQGFVLTTK
ncbi:MAG: FAD:protein FMN transferase [Desulfobacterales bacterium]|uniref:FAD:protein FMN transferase n=1 Tax=Candidatus Desulfaltia bathyphila TaxID=2841697 RepID=A0A8J6TBR8_9BACT|nr:FAD:protein FMN transferase [Candidatus Desulfaltia bathyphila]MBL7195409.1 FAD:protein FMN transferase [Desulfobacterales bacterium]MBL7208410.1 FAD:protein FMN transferase [Desulfobacterales bacterium]